MQKSTAVNGENGIGSEQEQHTADASSCMVVGCAQVKWAPTESSKNPS